MRLSIITINYNNAEGLRKTLVSVLSQTYRDIEHIIVDGGSTDGSVDVIKKYEEQLHLTHSTIHIKWTSEKDNGIYNAINKGIEIALGRRVVNEDHTSHIIHHTSQESLCDYIQILNSGDLLISDEIIEKMMNVLAEYDYPELLYGNAVDVYDGKRLSSHGPGIEYSMLSLYKATYPHDSTFFKRELFSNERYGLYDEELKIVSDWKWYLQAIGLGNVKPIYVDVDVTLFDVTGISSKNKELDKQERQQVLRQELPPAIYADYEKYAFPMSQCNRLKKHHLWGLVHFTERVLYKLEKLGILKK